MPDDPTQWGATVDETASAGRPPGSTDAKTPQTLVEDPSWLSEAKSGAGMFAESLKYGWQEDNPIDPPPTYKDPQTGKTLVGHAPGSEYAQREREFREKTKDRSWFTTSLPEFIGQTAAGGPEFAGLIGTGRGAGLGFGAARAADRAAVAAGEGTPGLRGGGAGWQRLEQAVGRAPLGGQVARAAQQRATVLSREAERFATNLAGESTPEMQETLQQGRRPLARAGQILQREAFPGEITDIESRRLVEAALANARGPENVFRALVTSRENPVAARQLIYPLVYSLRGVRNRRLLAGAMIDQLGRSSILASSGRVVTLADWNAAQFLENISRMDPTVSGRIFGAASLDTAELGSDLAGTWREIVGQLQGLERYRGMIRRAAPMPRFREEQAAWIRGAGRRWGWWAGEGAAAIAGIVWHRPEITAILGAHVTANAMVATALTNPRTARLVLAQLARTTATVGGIEYGTTSGEVSDMPDELEPVTVTGQKVPIDIAR